VEREKVDAGSDETQVTDGDIELSHTVEEKTSDEDRAEEISKGNENTEFDYLSQLQRVQAEFINYKKRIEQQRSEWQTLVTREILYQLLPILDDYDLFFKHEKHSDAEVKVGVRMIYDKMVTILADMGLEVISTDKAEFNPELHEAVHVKRSENTPHGQILEVWQKGYQFRGKLLRPAKVIVAESNDVKESDEQ
jgi:molecular chaperone GrpE